MTQRWATVAVVAAGGVVLACGVLAPGGGGRSGQPVAGSSPSSPSPSPSPIPTVPRDASELEDVCTDGAGYGALPAYVRGKGKPHKAVLLTNDGKYWVASSTKYDYPSAWFLPDKGDPKAVDAVVCNERVNAAPAGKTCKMQDSTTKKTVTVTLYNTAYRVRVREAHTGRTLIERLVTASSRRCPYMSLTISEDGQNKDFTEPTADQIRAVIKPVLAP
jgi:hypothetical protein